MKYKIKYSYKELLVAAIALLSWMIAEILLVELIKNI